MKIISTASEMTNYSDAIKGEGGELGFIPTMGALHEGHLSLVAQAKRENTQVVVSIFVNPTQFNNSADLEKYPRTFEKDAEMLRLKNVDVMFYPSISEVYPNHNNLEYEMDGLDKNMEGPNRPGHFNGVVQVVTRLFDLVKPNHAYFGEKDFQQLAIIRHMSSKLKNGVKIIGCETIRSETGLALSSRNTLLTESGLQIASKIYSSLMFAQRQFANGGLASQVLVQTTAILNNIEGLELEYLEFVNPSSLQKYSDTESEIQACVAAHIEGVRLIDNMRVK